jgi:hypothetical protein
MTDTTALLLPAVRWHAEHGFDQELPRVERALALGVGGFILFGGPAPAVRDLTRLMHARSRHPLLVGADLERGAGSSSPASPDCRRSPPSRRSASRTSCGTPRGSPRARRAGSA